MNGQIEGLSEVLAQLNSVVRANYLPAVEKGLRDVILPEMKALTPVDTGELRESEDVEYYGQSVALVAGTNHAVPVEFGTSRMAAQPYMRPAIDAKKDDAMRVIKEEADKIVKEAVKRV